MGDFEFKLDKETSERIHFFLYNLAKLPTGVHSFLLDAESIEDGRWCNLIAVVGVGNDGFVNVLEDLCGFIAAKRQMPLETDHLTAHTRQLIAYLRTLPKRESAPPRPEGKA